MNQDRPAKNYGRSIRVSVWKNNGPRGPFSVFRLERRYKDPHDGQWKSSATLTLPQALRMHALLGRAINDHLEQEDESATA